MRALPPETPHRMGYVALAGRPNVGKSTLLNALLGERLSIVTPRPETTRDRLRGVLHGPGAQLVLVDTPGIHRPHGRLGEYMNHEALAAIGDADLVVLVADARDGHAGPPRDQVVLEALAHTTRPVLLCLNKVDTVRPRTALLPLLEVYGKLRDFAAVVPVSGDTGEGLDTLRGELFGRLPEGVALFPDDALTDRPERYFVAEAIREAVLSETGEEVPYATAVELERFDERAPIPHITASVHVERPGQKKIMVGARGERIKAIGSRARASVERLLGRKIFLELWVKVTPDWTRSAAALTRFGYERRGKRS
ncbi:MAG: GTPase Era [Deltaproteobacteria bacterium]|nr:GTPase Era [Deltaproteobacteria bacterium]